MGIEEPIVFIGAAVLGFLSFAGYVKAHIYRELFLGSIWRVTTGFFAFGCFTLAYSALTDVSGLYIYLAFVAAGCTLVSYPVGRFIDPSIVKRSSYTYTMWILGASTGATSAGLLLTDAINPSIVEYGIYSAPLLFWSVLACVAVVAATEALFTSGEFGNEPEPEDVKKDPELSLTEYQQAIQNSKLPDYLKPKLIELSADIPGTALNHETIRVLVEMSRVLPKGAALGPGRTWRQYLHDHPNALDIQYTERWVQEKLLKAAMDIQIKEDEGIPLEARFEHIHILARSGHGKTQLIQQLILQDLEKMGSIVVIDSQKQMIEKLLHVVPEERLVYLSPENLDYPLALNSFNVRNDVDSITTAMELYEFIFASLENELTAKQSTVYRYVSRLLFAIPNANLVTMLEVLENGTEPYNDIIARLDPVVQSFFNEQYNAPKQNQYLETRRQIAQRLYRVLDNEYFKRMFTAPEGKIDLSKELRQGKVVLINTDRDKLKATGQRLFGRYWIAQLANHVFSSNSKVPVYLYIDEFQEYVSDDPIIMSLFEQGRKYQLAITIAHQNLDRLGIGLKANIMSNTRTKAVGTVSADDKSAMIKEMGVNKFHLDGLQKHHWRVSSGNQLINWKTDAGKLERLVDASTVDVDRIKRDQAMKYGYKYTERTIVDWEGDRPIYSDEDRKDDDDPMWPNNLT